MVHAWIRRVYVGRRYAEREKFAMLANARRYAAMGTAVRIRRAMLRTAYVWIDAVV